MRNEHIDRVGIEFYSRWKELKLGSVLEIKYGKDHKQLNDGNIPIYGSGGIMRFGDKALYDKKSILIPRKGSLNNIFYKDEPFWTVDTMFWSKIDEAKVFPKFLFYQLTTVDYSNLNVGSAVPSLTVPVIEAIDITLPPIQEQAAIASILSSLDDKIDLLHRQNKTLEQLAETLFRQWFMEEVEDSWEEKSLPEIADYLNGLALQKYPPKIDYLPVIKIREMKQGISENTDKCSREIPTQYVIHDGDVLFSWSGSLEVVLWTGGEGALNQHLFKVTSKVYPKWFYYLATKHHLNDFKTIAESKSTTMGHIQREHLNQAKISIPSKEMFKQYDERIAPLIDKQIENHKQIRTLTQTRNTLLPKLMSGEVRVEM